MIDKCKHCGSKELYLEPRIKGQDILTADMVALKCKSCGKWLKWCPKNERVNYLKIQDEKPDKWHKLKEWLNKEADDVRYTPYDCRSLSSDFELWHLNKILEKMQELEAEDDK